MPEAAQSQSVAAPPPQAGQPSPAAGAQSPPAEASPPPATEAPKTEAPTPEQRLLQLSEQERKLTLEKMRIGRERKAATEQMAKERDSIAKEKAELAAWKAEREDRRRNPAKYLKADYGDNWYETLSKVRLDGTPPGDLIASELTETEKRFEARLQALKEEFEGKESKRAEEETQRFRQNYYASAIEHVKTNADKYPLIHAADATGNIPQVIQAHWDQTVKTNDETGELEPGELLTAEQAAVKLEKYIEGIANKAIEAKQKREQPAPTQTPQRQQQSRTAVPNPPRRELSTDLTASGTSAPRPARTDKERLERAIAAAKASMSQRQTG